MTPAELINQAMAKGQSTLSEADSKSILASYGVPVVPESVVADADAAAGKAAEIGFPVVLKGLGAKLTHKSEMGLVRLGLGDSAQVKAAAAEMAQKAGADLEGFLVQPQLSGRREFVAGLFTDDQFGPVVMFGLGGVFTEALDDVAFRIAPIDENQAAGMLDELRSKSLIGPFRGEQTANRQQIIDTLVGLSRLALENPNVLEVDINPLLVSPDGAVTAVDALVVLGQPPESDALRKPIPPSDMAAIFHPKSVAFVGASGTFAKWGNLLFTNTLYGEFPGKIHLVNPHGGKIANMDVYKSVLDIPDEVDLAVVTIPAALVIGLIDDLEKKGVKSVVLISSGFSEVGDEGRELERQLVVKAQKAGITILGPNTMGICNPHHKFFCTGAMAKPDPGTTAFVSQSGNMGVQLLFFAQAQGIGIRAFAGSGNEAMVTVEDALDGFEVDGLTNTVLLYLESVKDGKRFLESARRVSTQKPVVVLKGGRTDVGGKAAASHTGALASNNRVFEAACQQAGVVMAEQPMELLDLSAAFSSLPLPKGRRVAIMTLGGGWGVVTADLCAEHGLEVVELSPEIIAEIDTILPPYWSRANPIDLVGESDPDLPLRVMDMLLAWDGCDCVIQLGILGRKGMVNLLADAAKAVNPDVTADDMETVKQALSEYEDSYINYIAEIVDKYQKPVVGVSLTSDGSDKSVYEVPGCQYKSVYFPTPERAVSALAKMAGYESWLEREGVPPEKRGLTKG